MNMKKCLRWLALLIAIATVGIWLSTGARRSWTSTEDNKETLDEVTGIVGVTQVKKFRAGVDFVGAGLLGAAILTGVSFLFRSKPKNSN